MSAPPTYTKEQLEWIMDVSNKVSEKTVLNLLISTVEEGPALGQGPCDELVTKIREKITIGFCGYLQCEFEEIKHRLNVSLTMVEKNYVASIDVPSDKYAQDLYAKYQLLKIIATAYWGQFYKDNTELLAEVAQYRPEVDFSTLHCDTESPTTLYFDPNSKFRVGIFPYYVDKNGKLLYKNKQ